MAKRGKQKQKGKAQTETVKPTSVPAAQEAAVATEASAVEVADAVIVPDAEAQAEAAVPTSDAADDVVVEIMAAEEPASEQAEPAPVASEPVISKKPKRAPRASARPREQRSPFLVLADYEQRSLAHIAGLPEQLDAPGVWRGVAYRVGAHRLASGFNEVIEILPLPALTHVPGSQAWMLGVANIRGTLLPVVDLKQFLEGERTVLHERQRVLVMRQPGGDVAVTIDELYGQRSFVDAQGIAADTLSEGRYAHFIDRAYRMNDQDWGVFSFERLARTPEFRQAAA